MDISNFDPQLDAQEATKLMIDKLLVINALKRLINDYPSEAVPRSVVRQALSQVMGKSAFGDLSEHPSIAKLDQTLIKAKSITST
jgi:hypothetical protein